MRKILLTVLLSIPFLLKAQKITFDKDTLLVDGKAYCIIIKEGCKLFQNCEYKVKSLTGKLVLLIRYESYKDPMEVRQSNPEGNITCATFNFLEAKTVAQRCNFYIKIEKIGKEIYKNGLFESGDLSSDAVGNYALINPRT